MKKMLSVMLALCMMMGVMAVFSGCGNKQCAHTYGNWTVVTPATCTQDGVKERTCSKCNDTEQGNIPAIGHNFVNGICTDCGASEE